MNYEGVFVNKVRAVLINCIQKSDGPTDLTGQETMVQLSLAKYKKINIVIKKILQWQKHLECSDKFPHTM